MIRVERGQDINALRGMIEAGLISEEDLSKMTITGGLVSSAPQQNVRQNASQQAQQPARKLRVIGYGNGQATDLGEEDWQAPAIDYTRAGIDVPGVGKGHYGADGRSAYVQTPQGMTKVLLGYDAEASDRRNDMELKRQMARMNIEQQGLQNEGLRQRNEMFAAGPSIRSMGSGQTPQELKPLTEAQGKALGFGMRSAEAHEILNTIGQGGAVQPSLLKRTAKEIPVIGDGLALMANSLPEALGGPSEPQLQVEQAQRNFINAVMRRESGAVISPEEFNNAALQYFPQPGDPPQVVAQKARNREMIVKSLSEETAGRGSMIEGVRQEAQGIYGSQAKKGAPQVGERRGNFIFNGGDPSQQSSWKRVK